MTDNNSQDTVADEVLFTNLAKGHRHGGQHPGYSWDWFRARRARLTITEDKVIFGDWIVPLSTIASATLYRGRQVFLKFFVLEIRTPDVTYQFSVRQKTGLAEKLPFEYESLKIRLRYSRFSILFRVALIGATAFSYWMLFGPR